MRSWEVAPTWKCTSPIEILNLWLTSCDLGLSDLLFSYWKVG